MDVCLFLNHACNMRCGYCYNGRKLDRRMPLETALRGVDLLSGSRPRLTFFGGEPLLELELVRKVVDYAAERSGGVDLRVVTNGTLLAGEALDFLLQRGFFIGISVDGCEAAHDAKRRFEDGRPSYATVARNVRELRRRAPGARARAIAVVDPDNVVHLARSLRALLELGLDDVAFNLNYHASWDEAARRRFSAALRELGDAYVECFRAGERLAVNIIDSKVAAHVRGGLDRCGRCSLGCEELTVAPSGNLYPCDRLVGEDVDETLVIGHVEGGVDLERRAALIAQRDSTPVDCADCELASRCVHWCGCVNHALTGSVGEVDGVLCWFEQRLIEEADRCAATLFEERNPLFVERFYPE